MLDGHAGEIGAEGRAREIELVERRSMQLSIEQQALKKETDAASRKRLEELSRELSELNEKKSVMRAKWLKEKEIIAQIRMLFKPGPR